jgi:hypothetical protein
MSQSNLTKSYWEGDALGTLSGGSLSPNFFVQYIVVPLIEVRPANQSRLREKVDCAKDRVDNKDAIHTPS